ncbi:hypothetical protein MS2017_2053 [Bathymodiolus thermophilus thioautotrophic gill symbiont]|uniref:Outer membrane protein beta-barrel domain-containing protein n=1 Tax=Bathymodiolus thermophilus thioautotrophic gill symbiont TaxID=2360 RepID=A0A3G3IPJ9_9GAMM|nr:hypothetical protein [Bathymodiolus thermophilus thioautotrophic gill symbiont]AYQ57710.1 hypothetical protein MS2017_2053 [Bathymodiolus thermophilus thioautotrophic gill symbiont]
MLKILLASLLFIASQVQAEMTLKHGFYLSSSVGSLKADISGKHQDFSGGLTENPTNKNATVHDGKISNARSFGYNLRYVPKVGFGYEVGLYFTKIKMPTQDAALMNDDNGGYIQIPKFEEGNPYPVGLKDAVVDSPSSYMSTTDLYLGGLYNFKVIDKVMPDTIFDKIMPYVGLGYAKVKGDWYKSHYDKSIPNDPAYGTKGKTSIDGHYLSAKAGINFNENYNVEIEHAKHKFHADAFRSFNINGSDAEFSRTSINFIYTF